MYPAQTAPYAAAKLAERLREAELARPKNRSRRRPTVFSLRGCR
jgi:hypothetical protein